ncbi:MAG TPA: tRNA (adenosine(37)-N6)-dimethylallyltransferase MiaA [Acinetobacter sp.]|uniref:tRNA (adenosine(37)-N6)-dimethylallyltransferase MiaA n=2 Tax=Gammaproteobacteria TaxID=1236 RepID=UPI000EBDEF24|nr:tRNA (adenosine(37)-N6)-dimethylallyltransferase MiaA [Escherichia coli]MDK9306989.1 tRNA (adenosine(37)-N6)-dimethylallyltransferase MiaA [Escherichia coli]HAB43434.1 tRNA (adenosine(37)-N6)-dimethylallyltransferase MiaA [Acinetobacter sp.]
MSNQLPVINLMGPTASGKTALACELYEQGRFELISVDSALVYREMDIGTAKPSKDELERYPHHLIDIISPLEVYSAANFVEDACRLIDDIHVRGKTPILVGGTMLYFKALLEGLSDNLPSADYAVRAQIEEKAAREGWEAVYAKLCQVDPLAGQKFKVSDKQRIIRALEVFKLTGEPITKLQAEQPKNLPYRYSFHNYALMPDRLELHKRIEKRLEIMWKNGFLNEVKGLMGKYDFDENLPSMRSVGYRQAIEFLKKGDLSHEKQQEMEDKALFATRQLAKRQYTWLRSLQEKHKFTTYFTLEQAQEDLRNCHG